MMISAQLWLAERQREQDGNILTARTNISTSVKVYFWLSYAVYCKPQLFHVTLLTCILMTSFASYMIAKIYVHIVATPHQQQTSSNNFSCMLYELINVNHAHNADYYASNNDVDDANDDYVNDARIDIGIEHLSNCTTSCIRSVERNGLFSQLSRPIL